MNSRQLTPPRFGLYDDVPLVYPPGIPARSPPLVIRHPTPAEVHSQVVAAAPQLAAPPVHDGCVAGVDALEREEAVGRVVQILHSAERSVSK